MVKMGNLDANLGGILKHFYNVKGGNLDTHLGGLFGLSFIMVEVGDLHTNLRG